MYDEGVEKYLVLSLDFVKFRKSKIKIFNVEVFYMEFMKVFGFWVELVGRIVRFFLIVFV